MPSDSDVAWGDASPNVHFFEQVQPLLSTHCFSCHGSDPGSRMGNLRLDTPEGLFSPRPNGQPVVIKGNPAASLLMKRVTAADPALRMPPVTAHWPLSSSDIAILEAWIKGGAPFPDHWAFSPPTLPSAPPVKDPGWVRQPIDLFVLAALEAAGRTHSAEADRRALIRRASLDARGLPPTPEEVAAFLADQSADAYERLVERFLADPAYGEHRATAWLDVVRYADTHGFGRDNYRSIWPYRDYVVRAFNDNMPFDRFTVEQLAGDLLPGATLEQRIATGFGRCAMSTGEGGTIEEELAAIVAKDRVETVANTWLGLTMGCASCHDHKFDPVTQVEFYRMAAFFRNTTQPVFDKDLSDQAPVVLVGEDKVPSLVTEEKPDAPFAHVLVRGRYDQPGERVTPGVPAVLPPIPAGQPANRLGLARWLTAPGHPLMARVVVNRFWAEVFGAPLVPSADNFGTTGVAPSNRPLLDWLACEFRDSGWNVKQLFRRMLTSATYRQTSAAPDGGDATDPDNRLLGRGPGVRLAAEVIRDQALAASGLLVRRLGGPPVKPYQPAGVWEAVGIDQSNTARYQQDAGDGLYRRSLYTFRKRSAPPPFLQIFDAPSRESTVAQRGRTNTPLQALAATNDVQMLEAARALAMRVLMTGPADTDGRLDAMGGWVLARPFDADERAILKQSLDQFLARYENDAQAAALVLAIGASPVKTTVPAPIQAAWMMIASAVLNLDEALTK